MNVCFDENGRNVQVRNQLYSFMYPSSLRLHLLYKFSFPPSQASSPPGVSGTPKLLTNSKGSTGNNFIRRNLHPSRDSKISESKSESDHNLDLPYTTLPLITTGTNKNLILQTRPLVRYPNTRIG